MDIVRQPNHKQDGTPQQLDQQGFAAKAPVSNQKGLPVQHGQCGPDHGFLQQILTDELGVGAGAQLPHER
jgi:hypothetical protein